ncbi:MAG: NAD(P)-dependent oxidoreductase [Actinomycetota bacterium]
MAADDDRVGVIGLGLMGAPIVRRLAECGRDVVAHSRRHSSFDAVAEAATWAGSPAEVAACPTILLSLPADEQVVGVTEALLPHLRPGAVVIDTSTTHPDTARRLAAALTEVGAGFVDAPVSGGPTAAAAGTLSTMVGGDPDAVTAARPTLDAVADRITVIGGPGAGQVAKACNQAIVGTTINAVAEALALAQRNGADPGAVRAALLGGYASSRVLELHGRRMLDDDLEPGGRVATQLKDLGIVADLAERSAAAMPVTAAARQRYGELVDAGHADLDHAAVWLLTRADGLPRPTPPTRA